MPIACPVDLDTLKLRAEIQSIYARVAADPSGEFHFHRGPDMPRHRLGYDAAELAKLPRAVTESFAGVGNPHAIAPLPAGATVVDIGSRRGMDLLLAALACRPDRPGDRRRHDGGHARARTARRRGMRALACRGARRRRHALPVETASVDVVISNGVLNLVAREAIGDRGDRAHPETGRPRPDRRHRPRRRAARGRATGHRSLDRLNRRCSAGSRACRGVRGGRVRRRANYASGSIVLRPRRRRGRRGGTV